MMYELKKFIFNKRNVGVFGFLVFFLICFIGYNVYMDKHYNESQIKIYQKAYRISENRMDEAGSEEESEFWKKVYRNASGLIHFYYNSENKTDEFIESKLSWNHLMLQANNEGYIINDFEKRDVQTLQNETKQLKYLKKNHIEMSSEIYEAMMDLRKIMFQNVYDHPEAKKEEKKAIKMLKKLYTYYIENPDEMSAEYRQLMKKGESKTQVVCDYLAGMTDQYSMAKFRKIYIPKAWEVY